MELEPLANAQQSVPNEAFREGLVIKPSSFFNSTAVLKKGKLISYELRMDKPYVYSSCEQFNKAKGQNCRGTFSLMSYLALRSNIHSSAIHPCRCSSACFPFPLLLSAFL